MWEWVENECQGKCLSGGYKGWRWIWKIELFNFVGYIWKNVKE